jgi:hypothetical protein
MPAKDGTGPKGKGSRTGRVKGKCKPTKVKNTKTSTAKATKPSGSG